MTTLAAVETDPPGRWNAAADHPDGFRYGCTHRHATIPAALACARFALDRHLHPDALDAPCPHKWAAPNVVGRLEAHVCYLSEVHDGSHLCSCGLEEVTA